jgi:hypothetical protein
MAFTLLNAVILRPLPIKDAGEVITIYQNLQGIRRFVFGTVNYLAYPEYEAYRDQSRSLEALSLRTRRWNDARAVQTHGQFMRSARRAITFLS